MEGGVHETSSISMMADRRWAIDESKMWLTADIEEARYDVQYVHHRDRVIDAAMIIGVPMTVR